MKQLPEKIALDKAVQGQRLYQGSVEIQQMSRLANMLADTNGSVDFSIQFARARGLLGKAQVKVKAELSLMCTISHKKFMFSVDINSSVGFIDDLTYEEMLDVDMEASWVKNGFVNPLELIEDELILVVPDTPFAENHHTDDESEQEIVVTNQEPNPFDVLKNLK